MSAHNWKFVGCDRDSAVYTCVECGLERTDFLSDKDDRVLSRHYWDEDEYWDETCPRCTKKRRAEYNMKNVLEE